MKKILYLLTAFIVLGIGASSVNAQSPNYALIDMQYLTGKIPQYKEAIEQIKKSSEQWEKEVKNKRDEAKQLYERYQKELPTLSANQKVALENKIVSAEEQAGQLRQKYFGPKGEVMKLQETLVKPIQDKIYEAVKIIAKHRGYLMVLERSSTAGIIYADPQADISNDVLAVLGLSE